MNEKTIDYIYKFVFKNGSEKTFNIKIDSNSLTAVNPENEPPEWAKLKNFACPHCPISRVLNTYCPVAVNLKEIIVFFTDTPSYETAKIYAFINNRQYFKETSVQVGVSSIIGILMATSGCPIMAKMKPLARYHLPFADLEETEFRVLSMFLLAQFLRKKNGLEPDWDLKGVTKIYDDIQILNQNVAKRIADLEKLDASINAVVVLDNFANFVTFSIEEKDFDHLEQLFKEYL